MFSNDTICWHAGRSRTVSESIIVVPLNHIFGLPDKQYNKVGLKDLVVERRKNCLWSIRTLDTDEDLSFFGRFELNWMDTLIIREKKRILWRRFGLEQNVCVNIEPHGRASGSRSLPREILHSVCICVNRKGQTHSPCAVGVSGLAPKRYSKYHFDIGREIAGTGEKKWGVGSLDRGTCFGHFPS